jgi:hypothetical protein
MRAYLSCCVIDVVGKTRMHLLELDRTQSSMTWVQFPQIPPASPKFVQMMPFFFILGLANVLLFLAGSRMTANLSSFLRFKFNKGGMAGGSGSMSAANEEQDLGGFAEAVSHTSLRMSTRDVDKNGMGTIQEGADEEPSPARVRR